MWPARRHSHRLLPDFFTFSERKGGGRQTFLSVVLPEREMFLVIPYRGEDGGSQGYELAQARQLVELGPGSGHLGMHHSDFHGTD